MFSATILGSMLVGPGSVLPPPGSCGVAKDRVEDSGPEVQVKDWFFSTKPCPKG